VINIVPRRIIVPPTAFAIAVVLIAVTPPGHLQPAIPAFLLPEVRIAYGAFFKHRRASDNGVGLQR